MSPEMLRKIDLWIDGHRDDIVKDIIRLANIKSVSQPGNGVGPYGDGCKAVLDEMLRLGEEKGFIVKNYEDHCGSLCLKEGDMENTIGFWGHLDVVPEGDNWEYEPYNVTEKDGYLIGRGVDDNKGPTVANLYVMLCLKELGIELKHDLKLFVGCDEERGMSDLAYYRSNYPCPKMSIIADAGFPVCYAEKGIMEINVIPRAALPEPFVSINGGRASNMVADYAEVTLKDTPQVCEKLSHFPESFSMRRADGVITVKAYGVSKHAAFPEGGVNAIYLLTTELEKQGLTVGDWEKAFALYNRINQDFYGTGLNINCEDEESGNLTCVGGMISTTDGKMALNLNIRYPVTADSKELIAKITAVCNEYDCDIELEMDSAPNYFNAKSPIVQKLTAIYNEMTGQNEAPYVMGGGTYARKLPNAFAFGLSIAGSTPPDFLKPQHGGGHEPDEALNIENLLTAMKIYCRSLIAIDDDPLE